MKSIPGNDMAGVSELERRHKRNPALKLARFFVWLAPTGAAFATTIAALALTRYIYLAFGGVRLEFILLGANILFACGAGYCEAFLQGKRAFRETAGIVAGFLLLQVLLVPSLGLVIVGLIRGFQER